MNLTGLGDRAHLFLSQRHNVDLRTQLATKTQEMTTGTAVDLVAHLGGDVAPIADLDRRLALAEAYGSAAREVGNRLSLMENALGQAETLRADLLEQLMAPNVLGDSTIAARAGKAAFEDLVSIFNARSGSSALFAGTGTEGAVLASAQEMMDSILAHVEGSASATEVTDRLDDWFDSPAGGFATLGYRGSTTHLARQLDVETTVTLQARADDPAIRGLLKAAALAALAEDPALPLPDGAASDLVTKARDELLFLSSPLTEVRAGLGQAQARVEDVTARHAARATAWSLLRNELTQKDPYATASEVEALRTQLEMHYELTSRLSSLSLVSFLR